MDVRVDLRVGEELSIVGERGPLRSSDPSVLLPDPSGETTRKFRALKPGTAQVIASTTYCAPHSGDLVDCPLLTAAIA
jgi:hypothetical protein